MIARISYLRGLEIHLSKEEIVNLSQENRELREGVMLDSRLLMLHIRGNQPIISSRFSYSPYNNFKAYLNPKDTFEIGLNGKGFLYAEGKALPNGKLWIYGGVLTS